MARFETNTPEEIPGLFSSPLLLVKHKRKIDNFHNNILIRLVEKLEPGNGNEALKDFVRMHQYIGCTSDKKNLVTRTPAKYDRQNYPQGPGKEGEYLIKLLEELEKDQVTVILTALPDYWGSYKTNFQRVKFIRNLRLLQKYKNVYVLNYNHRERFPLEDPELFNDGGYGQTNSHLSQKGAKQLCEILLDDIKKYY
jgi:hypothetical protein